MTEFHKSQIRAKQEVESCARDLNAALINASCLDVMCRIEVVQGKTTGSSQSVIIWFATPNNLGLAE